MVVSIRKKFSFYIDVLQSVISDRRGLALDQLSPIITQDKRYGSLEIR